MAEIYEGIVSGNRLFYLDQLGRGTGKMTEIRRVGVYAGLSYIINLINDSLRGNIVLWSPDDSYEDVKIYPLNTNNVAHTDIRIKHVGELLMKRIEEDYVDDPPLKVTIHGSNFRSFVGAVEQIRHVVREFSEDDLFDLAIELPGTIIFFEERGQLLGVRDSYGRIKTISTSEFTPSDLP